MAHTPVASQLPAFIAQLWRRPADRADLAAYLVARLSAVDRLLLAAWDTAATFGPPSGRLSLVPPQTMQVMDSRGRLLLSAALVGVAPAPGEHQCLITYRDGASWVIVQPSSPNIPNASFSHSFQSLLLAMQLIRDHLDSVLLYPPELRGRTIEQFAASSQLGEEHFRSLAGWFPTVEVYARP